MTELQKRLMEDQLNTELFQELVHQGVAYLREARQRHVYPTAEALEQLSVFDEPLPVHAAPAKTILHQLHQVGAPATVTSAGGRYFGFVTGGALPAGIGAKLLGTFWDQGTAMQVMSPIAAKLEGVVEKWLKQIFGLPDSTVAGFVTGSSAANLCGLAAGRFRLYQNLGWEVARRGLVNAPSLKIVTGREAHSTVLKAISLLGFGVDSITYVDTDDQGRLRPELLPEPDERTLLILQAGNVNSGSFDDFRAMAARAEKAGAWVHIDGAFGLWAAAAQKLSYLTDGIGFAHSWAVDGHKTLNTPYDCGMVLCRDAEALRGALHMQGGYLVTGAQRDGMFFTPDMSRRARILELWAVMKYLGEAGIDELVTTLHERARQFARGLAAVPGISILNDVVFNQVVVAADSDEMTERLLQGVQEQRVCWVGGSSWRGRRVIRISVCSWATTEEDVAVSVKSFEKVMRTLQTAQGG